jgi:uncharacterized protein YndB with AHSA1/START domain
VGRTAKPAIDDTVEIARPIDVVWSTIIDWPVAGEWMPNMKFCEDPSEIRAGDRIAFRYHDQPSTITIEEVSAPRRLVMRRTNGPVEATFAYDLTESPRGTRMHVRADLAAEEGIGLMRPLLRRALARTDRVQLSLLKSLVEGDDSAR